MKGKLLSILIAVLLSAIVFSGCFEENKKPLRVGTEAIYVDDSGGKDYTTIQDAINNATDGDIIYVLAGTYELNRQFAINKSISLMGNGSADTFIVGDFEVVTINANLTNISGFTIRSNMPYISGIHGIIGIQLIDAHNCRIENNKILTSNHFNISSYGISFQSSSNNTIVNNMISTNVGPGIFLYYNCDNNKIYNNNFINNSPNAKDYTNNIWDNGKYGNYWDDYNGTDEDDDGIGDTPYSISGGNNQDLYPLMNPLITSTKEIEEYIGQKVTVIGTLECNPDPPNRFGKFVPGLIFNDGTEIGFTAEVPYCDEYQDKEIELTCEVYQCGLEDSCEGIFLTDIELIE